MKGAKVKWQVRTVQAEQALVTAELTELAASAGTNGALRYALRQVQNLENGDDHAQMRRLIYILATLALHLRSGGLKPKQINEAVLLARGLLTAYGVQPGSSRLAFLHADLHLLLSQIQHKRGKHWFAAWEQQIALQEVRRLDDQVRGQHLLAMGQRALRIGHAGLALSYFSQAAAAELTPTQEGHAWIGQIRAYRLSSDHPQCGIYQTTFSR